MNKKSVTRKKFWRFLADFWAIATMALFIFEIFIMKKSDTIANLASMVYISILGIYAGKKEFYRWRQQHYMSLHWGEMFVVYWTGLMIIVFSFSVWNGIRLPEGLTATYVAVITIFALTKKSKSLYYKKRFRR